MLAKRYHKRKRRGVASAIGILFMVGILMTSILPMFMYVNQVNNWYDTSVVEMKMADDDRGSEELQVYAYGASSTTISVWLRNSGAIPINVSRVWAVRADLKKIMIFNSTNRPDNFTLQIPASSHVTVKGLDLTSVLTFPLVDNENVNKFNIYAVTERGNKFASETNTLAQSGSGWETSTMEFLINIMLQSASTNTFKLKVYNASVVPKVFVTEKIINDVHGTGYTLINVPKAGLYNVTCQRKSGNEWPLVDEKSKILTWTRPATWVEFTYPPP